MVMVSGPKESVSSTSRFAFAPSFLLKKMWLPGKTPCRSRSAGERPQLNTTRRPSRLCITGDSAYVMP